MSATPNYTTVKTELIAALKAAAPTIPVYLQGSLLGAQKYPDSFFTFWNDDTFDGSHYDNDPLYYVWRFTVSVFSSDPETVNVKLYAVRDQLKARGFIVDGIGSDAYSDEITHTGRSLNCSYMDFYKNPQEVNND